MRSSGGHMISSDTEEEELEATVRERGYTCSTRRCTSTNPNPDHPQGRFYPNYKTDYDAIVAGSSRPTGEVRDSSLDALFTTELQAKINALLPATGIVYAGVGGPGQLDGTSAWQASHCSTFWLLEHNSKLVGVTALHIFRFSGQACRVYVNKTKPGNYRAEWTDFQRQDVTLADFVEVQLRDDLLQIRKQYIQQIHTSHDAACIEENLDPEFTLQFANTCDIAFIDLEPCKHHFQDRPCFKLATNPPAVGDMDLLIAYNYAGPWARKELEDKYQASIAPPRPGVLYYANYRTVSLGKVQKVGTGFITDISTSEEMSSGGPKLFVEGGELCVFGIGVGSYYDAPNPVPEPADWTIFDSGGLVDFDIQLPEPGRTNKATPKNRNLILSLQHSCVKAMLAGI